MLLRCWSTTKRSLQNQRLCVADVIYTMKTARENTIALNEYQRQAPRMGDLITIYRAKSQQMVSAFELKE